MPILKTFKHGKAFKILGKKIVALHGGYLVFQICVIVSLVFTWMFRKGRIKICFQNWHNVLKCGQMVICYMLEVKML